MHVELDHPLPLRQGRADRRAEQHHAGVVDERVEAAQLGDRPLDGVGRLLLVGDVGLQHQRRAALVADARGERPPAGPCAGPRAPRPPPRPASAAAVAAPMPLDAPVTSATVPSSTGFTTTRLPCS